MDIVGKLPKGVIITAMDETGIPRALALGSVKFDLGMQVMTQGIANILGNGKICEELLDAFGRYKKCDWGDVPEEDKALNDEAVRVGDGRTLAAYNTSRGEIWIITDFGDEGNVTTMLLPEEY